MSKDEITEEEFYEDFVRDSEKPRRVKLLSQRIPDNDLIALVAKQCQYKKHEVEDVLKGLWSTINNELEQGREINIGGMFVARLYKPHSRRLYNPKTESFRMTDPRPRFKCVATDMYQKYLWRGIHAPINYFPPERKRNQDKTRLEFTKMYNTAYNQWLEEQSRRDAKKEKEKSSVN